MGKSILLIIRLAWRNLWRKRKRSLISISAVVFAVLFAILIDSLQKGAWKYLINNIVNYYYGHAQIQKKDYWDNPSLDESFQLTDKIYKELSQSGQIKDFIPRIESFALAATPEKSYGVMLIGTDPDVEKRVSSLDEKVIAGEYLHAGKSNLMITEGVADILNASINDTIVLISQGYHGVNAVGKYHISGIIQLGPPELNNRMIYMPLGDAQQFYGADSLVTSIALNLTNPNQLKSVIAKLKTRISQDRYDIKTWMELLPDLVQARDLDSAANYVVYFILYLVIAFGIFATMIMMIKEREYETGILLSIGMSRIHLSLSLWTEAFLLGLLGSIIGGLVAFPVVLYFFYNPIRMDSMAEVYEKFGFEPVLPTTVDPGIFINQAIIVFIISLLVSIYPITRIFKTQIINALKG